MKHVFGPGYSKYDLDVKDAIERITHCYLSIYSIPKWTAPNRSMPPTSVLSLPLSKMLRRQLETKYTSKIRIQHNETDKGKGGALEYSCFSDSRLPPNLLPPPRPCGGVNWFIAQSKIVKKGHKAGLETTCR